jgi:hypothetical protein
MRVYGLRLDEIGGLDMDLFEQMIDELPRG